MEKGSSVQDQCACEPGRTLGLVIAVSIVRTCRNQGVIQIERGDLANSALGHPAGSNIS